MTDEAAYLERVRGACPRFTDKVERRQKWEKFWSLYGTRTPELQNRWYIYLMYREGVID